jgi:hypothetical protein
METPPGEQFPQGTRRLLNGAIERVLERMRAAQESEQEEARSREGEKENCVDQDDSPQKNA